MGMSAAASHIPLVDVSSLVQGGVADEAAALIDRACRDHGFFYATGHGVDPGLEQRLEAESRKFFALHEEQKLELEMRRGGAAWRGYFPVGAELTSGEPDQKEGLYFGAELAASDPRVAAGTPLHGPNLFPEEPGLREAVLATIDAMTTLGHALMEGVALALGLDRSWFRDRYTRDPLVLFRIFHYPPLPAGSPAWSVGEHTDYGLLTMLRQDDAGGLQVETRSGWIDAPPIPGSYVCNIGDMLDLMTRGRYRSTPHRVRNASTRSRLSFPFFFDPEFDVRMQPLPLPAPAARSASPRRWDGADVHAFDGTYGDYLLGKVSKVFPALRNDVL